MPAYDYDCAACGRRFEVIHGVHADPPSSCPLCGKGPIRKAITAAAVHYRGSGWAKKERRATASSGSKAQSDGNASSAGGSSTDKGSTTDKGSSSDRGSSTDMGSSSDKGSSSDRSPSSNKGSSSETAKPASAKAADAGPSSTID
jgi:putative FmdB family regulatory protein